MLGIPLADNMEKLELPVGRSEKSNELGLYDMSGNVWEWCGDLYTKEYKQGGKSIHPGWPFEGTYLFSAEYCEVEVGEEQQRGVGCRTLITTLKL